MSVTIIRPATREEWLDLRKGGIGSSEVGSILGVNPYKTPYAYWLEKTGQVPPPEENMAMRLGHLMEGVVAQLYEDATGNKVDKSTEGDWLARSDFREYTCASPDRICVTPDGGRVLLECKTTRLNVSEDDYPKSWFCQVQYLLACTEMDEGAIAWLKGGSEFGMRRVRRDPKFQDFMFKRLDAFWENCMKMGIAPAPQSADDVLSMFPSEKQPSVECDERMLETIQEYKRLKVQQDYYSDALKEKEEEIKMFMGGAGSLTFGGDVVVTWKTGKPRTTFDAKAFAADHPEMHKEYLRDSQPVRYFRVK